MARRHPEITSACRHLRSSKKSADRLLPEAPIRPVTFPGRVAPVSWPMTSPALTIDRSSGTAMNDISKVRFDALASYARHPLASFLSVELRWLEFADERVLATLILDTDGEFSGVILAQDMK